MSELEDRLGAILNNPQMMQQILSMAQAMGAGQPQPGGAPQGSPPPAQSGQLPGFPDIDPNTLRSLAGMAVQSNVDQNQKTLLLALSPYLSPYRIQKLERAMRAAKLAKLASGFLNAGGLQLLTGR